MIECVDWSTDQIFDALAKLGLDDNTLVVSTSDNGPCLAAGDHRAKGDGKNCRPAYMVAATKTE